MKNEKYVMDSWAWVEYLRGTRHGYYVKNRIEGAQIFTSAVTLAEVTSKFVREGYSAEEAYETITSVSSVLKVDSRFAASVGALHANIKKTRPNFSLADAFSLCTARSLHAKVLTGDPDFKGMKEAVMLK